MELEVRDLIDRLRHLLGAHGGDEARRLSRASGSRARGGGTVPRDVQKRHVEIRRAGLQRATAASPGFDDFAIDRPLVAARDAPT